MHGRARPSKPVIGVTFDGTGYGTDGAIWGGEFLVGDCAASGGGHLRYVGCPAATRRSASRGAWRSPTCATRASTTIARSQDSIPPSMRGVVRQMLEQRLNTPLTSSVGRLFDAVAALAGVRDRSATKGRRPMRLEGLASAIGRRGGPYPFDVDERPDAPLRRRYRGRSSRAVGRGRDRASAAAIAGRFHSTMVDLIAGGLRAAPRGDGRSTPSR